MEKFVHGKIYMDGHFVEGGILFDERILALGTEVTDHLPFGEENFASPSGDFVSTDLTTHDLEGCYVIPGLVDVHTHGAMGEDASDGEVTGLRKMAHYYAREGVTSFLPTTMTLKEGELTRAMMAIRSCHEEASNPQNAHLYGAKIAGIHMEGPFVSYAKRGAQNAENLQAPDVALFRRLNEVSGGLIRLITIAPEEAGALDFIRKIAGECAVSLGHSITDYETAMEAYRAGASHTTHLYNGMPGLHHREPGLIGAAYDSRAFVELIPDGLHVNPAVMRMTSTLFGEKLVLISDSLRCAGMPDGDYVLGGQPITMKGGKAVLSGSDTLAGSSIHLMEGIRRCVADGIPLETAIYAATAAAAKAIRLEEEIGSLKVGRWADFVILNDELQVKAVYINGKKYE